MARPELGTKRICPTTGKKFYDLNNDPVISPYSGEVVPTSVTGFSRGATPTVARKDGTDDEEEETDGPEIVSLDEVEDAEESADTSSDGDDADDGATVEDDTLVVDDDDDDTSDLVEVEGDDDND